MKKLDVLLLTSVHPPFDTRIYHKFFCSIKKSGFNVKILLPNQSDLAISNGDVLSVKGFNRKSLRILNNLLLLFKCFSISPKLVIFFDPDLLPFMLFFKLFSGASVIFDNHEDYAGYIMIKESIPLWLRNVVRRIYLIFLFLAKRIFDCVFYADQFTMGTPSDKLKQIVIYNFPIIEDFPILEKKYDLIYPGSIDLTVCQRLLNIMELLDDRTVEEIKFLLIGRDVNSANRSLIEEKKKELRKVHIEFLEDLSYEMVQNKISESKIGLVPLPDVEKFRKNIPIKLFEFMMHSIPVIGSDLPPISSFLNATEGNFCIKEQGYATTYCEKIMYILANYSSFSEMAQRNYLIMKENWNWEKTEEPKLTYIISKLTRY